MLDPEIIFLNHGSFGACPRPVFEIYQDWQRRLERQPVLFLGREFSLHDRQARTALGEFLGAQPDNLVFVPNATHAVNIIARSLDLQSGDEILTTDHEYGACDYTWEFIAAKRGARCIRLQIPVPFPADDEIVDRLFEKAGPRTRAIFLSHVTSPTALTMPVGAICRRARQEGILSVIDGAHAPGQIDLDLDSLGADFYTGNCHKWMLAPKGSAFLYARPNVQPLIEPLIVSWGYRANAETTSGSKFVDYLSWTGTRDPAAVLSVPAAIRFMAEHDWQKIRQECHSRAVELRRKLLERIGGPALCSPNRFIQMFSAALPPQTDIQALKAHLYEHHRIEVPLLEWNQYKLIRVSVQAYNSAADLNALAAALDTTRIIYGTFS